MPWRPLLLCTAAHPTKARQTIVHDSASISTSHNCKLVTCVAYFYSAKMPQHERHSVCHRPAIQQHSKP
jgi:hypothetical protein